MEALIAVLIPDAESLLLDSAQVPMRGERHITNVPHNSQVSAALLSRARLRAEKILIKPAGETADNDRGQNRKPA